MTWPVNARTSAMMDEAQSLYGATITATQGSPSFSVGASAGTHDGQGVIDVVGADLDAIVAAMRQVGFAAWHRTTAQGFTPHVHGVAIGEPLLSAPAALQVQSYLAGTNGLRDNGADDGPRDWVGVTWETYSGGTYTPPSGGAPVIVAGLFPGDRSGSYGYLPDATLAGTPSLTGGNTFNRYDIATVPAPVTLHLGAGDQCVFALNEDWGYYTGTEALDLGRWIIRATGGGALACADAWDEGYNYPDPLPTTYAAASYLGTVGDFAYYAADAALLDAAHLRNDGQPLLRLTCTAGSLDITWVGLQIQPAAGYYDVTDGFGWSATQAASTQEPAMNGFGTYATYTSGGVEKWTVDNQPVQDITGNIGAWNGSGTSYVDPQTAREASLADFGPWTTSSDTAAYADLVHVPGGGIIFDPEHWDAALSEQVTVFTAPSKAIIPSVPDGYYAIPGYLRLGFDGYEWLDSDTSLQGWHLWGGSVQFKGDADTFTLLLTEVADGFDTSSEWYAGGSPVFGSSVGDTDPFGTPVEVAIPDAFVTTSAQLMARRIELGRKGTDQLSFWTPENGYSAGNSGTSVNVTNTNIVRARFRIPPWRYKTPTFVSSPGPAPVIDFDDDVFTDVTYLRNKQRNDGLGAWSATRSRGVSSQQRSLRNRGYR